MLSERLQRICDANNISFNQLERECGLSNGSLKKWKTSTPSVDKVKTVADYFGVSVDFLLTGREAMLTASDSELLRKWARLDDFGKQIVSTVLDGEIERTETISQLSDQKNAIHMLRSLQPASAGTGIEIGIADMEIVSVTDSPEARRAKFIVRVSGDSMLPIYQDGDQLLIEPAEDINVGEIGLFVVGGRGFIKQRGIKELISLNKSYENIPLSPETVCNGKVIGIIKESDIK